ncbi:Uma2 family endonuclease [Bacillus horti]|uniref:Uma2 family endonuclease n=1 Tax=Caldalkalibacillus horti TaxID=77523 RepID=A0ABT9VZR8_9BACI|nr:Uma2 family endonuclease [Bacillus horti]MDQ0166322.1 Uma2 family endonuclease [Bacillus horti]
MKPTKRKTKVKENSLTYHDYANLSNDGNNYELVDGALELMTPSPTPKHQLVSFYMQKVLTDSCLSYYIVLSSPVDLILSDTEVRQPDLVMVHRDRISMISKRGIEGVPDLVVEILSPHSVKRDKQSKLKSYAKHQIPEYWIVDPANEALEQYMLTNNEKSKAERHYELINVYDRTETVQSERLSCVSFTVAQIVEPASELP